LHLDAGPGYGSPNTFGMPLKMSKLETWVNGVVGGFIGASSNVITLLIVDPGKFSPTSQGGWGHLGEVVLVSGVVGAALYLKNHPTPFDSPQTPESNK